MGFTEYAAHPNASNNYVTGSDAIESTSANVGVNNESGDGSGSTFKRLPDQEILDGMEEIYFEDGANCERYELEVCVGKYKIKFIFVKKSIFRNTTKPIWTPTP